MIPKDGRSFYFEEPREIKEPAAFIWSEARRGEGCEGRLCGGEADRRSRSVPIPLELTKIYQGIRMH
jgi:hypothetical protein